MLSRRSVLQVAARLPLLCSAPLGSLAAARSETALKSLTSKAEPISADERRARLAKLRELMGQRKIGAVLIEPGSSLEYFTGIKWWRSERTTVAIIPAQGQIYVVTPAFEEPSVRETLEVSGDVRPWNEHESPFERIVQALRDRGVASGKIAFENTTRLFIVDGVLGVSNGAYQVVSGDGLVRACRLIK